MCQDQDLHLQTCAFPRLITSGDVLRYDEQSYTGTDLAWRIILTCRLCISRWMLCMNPAESVVTLMVIPCTAKWALVI